VATSDWELVQRSQAGDHEAFRELVERYQRKIAALALGMLRNREDASDVVQETFAKAYTNLDRFKGDSALYTWLYRIAFNLCVDHQRRDARQSVVPLEVDERGGPPLTLPEGEPPRDDPFQRTRDAELGRRLDEAIRSLTPEHRAVILLREIEGLSYEEISHVLQVPKGTVMSRLHYARRQLQTRLRGLL
jgi:RNA polymerase sigma-70 factor (ECF subfamily)